MNKKYSIRIIRLITVYIDNIIASLEKKYYK